MLNRDIINTAMRLSSLIYETTDIVYSGLDLVKTIENRHTNTQGAMLEDKANKVLYIVFRGTQEHKDILTDAYCLQTEMKVYQHSCKVHVGFHNAYESVKKEITLENFRGHTVVVCGHSLGGALATLCATVMDHQNVNCITFGSPRVGNDNFVDIFKMNVRESYRFVHENDVVPMVPKINYDHVTGRVRIDDNGNEISYMNIWKRISYWLKGFKSFDFRVFSLKDHFMDNYIKAITLWLAKK